MRHVEGTGPARKVGDDTGGLGRAQTREGESHMISQQVELCSFGRERPVVLFSQDSYMARKLIQASV